MLSAENDLGTVILFSAKAGSVFVFNEALVHGDPENKSVTVGSSSPRRLMRNVYENEETRTKIKNILISYGGTDPTNETIKVLKALKNLNLKNVELNVCSSTKIYGKKFDSVLGKTYEGIFNECKNTKNVNYHGFLENKKICLLYTSDAADE